MAWGIDIRDTRVFKLEYGRSYYTFEEGSTGLALTHFPMRGFLSFSQIIGRKPCIFIRLLGSVFGWTANGLIGVQVTGTALKEGADHLYYASTWHTRLINPLILISS